MSCKVVVDKDHWIVVFLSERLDEIENMTGTEWNSKVQTIEYVMALETLKTEIDKRISSCEDKIAEDYEKGEMCCETCGKEAGWGGCDNDVCPDNALTKGNKK